MLLRHAATIGVRLTCSQARQVATVTARTRRPARSPRNEHGSDGLNAFVHHFAPQQLDSSGSQGTRNKRVTLQQHLQNLSRVRTRANVADVRLRPRKTAAASRSSHEKKMLNASTAASGQDASERDIELLLPRKRGRPRKKRAEAYDLTAKEPTTTVGQKRSATAARGPEASRTMKSPSQLVGSTSPPRVALRSEQIKHHDLASFRKYALARNLNPASTVFRGTSFEYMVQQALREYHFSLHRTGQANDLGIDLLGQWSLPWEGMSAERHLDSRVLKVLVQCKLSTAQPCNVRELEGAYVGAPTGWRGDGVMAFLVSSKPATFGVRAALQRSRLPMGFLQITEEGHVQQFIWNSVAQEARLTGMSATREHSVAEPTTAGKIALLYQGRPV